MATIKNFPNNRDEYIGCEPVMKWLHGRTSGVFGADEGLAVSANDDMTVSVSDGPAWLSNAAGNGCVIWNDTEETTGSKLTLEVGIADPSRPRIDRVVASWDTIDYTALPEIFILQGAPASNPQPPALTNTTLKRQISLAKYRVSAAATKITAADITDERLDPEVCGLVTESVAIDTSVMQAQFTALLDMIHDELERLNAGTEAMMKTEYDPQELGKSVCLQVYSHTKTGTVHNFAGAGMYGRAYMTDSFSEGDTITLNGEPVSAFCGVDPVDGDALPVNTWVVFIADETGKKMFFLSNSVHKNDLEFQPGDTFGFTRVCSPGFSTTAGTALWLDIPLPKPISSDVSSVSIKGGGIIVRGDKGYVIGSSSGDVSLDSLNITSYLGGSNVRFTISSKSAFNVTNNTPVVAYITDSVIEFS